MTRNKVIESPVFRLHYHLRNHGDGSASAKFHQTEREADQADQEQDEGWGEPSASYLQLRVINGVIYFRDYDDSYTELWTPLERQL